jgi:hypothetical protein
MGDKITTCGYRVLTLVECTTIMTAELAVTSGLGSSFDEMVWMGMRWFWSRLCGIFVILCAPLCHCDHTLRILIQLNWVVIAYNFNIEDRC